jgi:hypothetical protein
MGELTLIPCGCLLCDLNTHFEIEKPNRASHSLRPLLNISMEVRRCGKNMNDCFIIKQLNVALTVVVVLQSVC